MKHPKILLIVISLLLVLSVLGLARSEFMRYKSNQTIEAINKAQKRQLEDLKAQDLVRVMELEAENAAKDVTLDSLNLELAKKQTQSDEVHEKIKLLSGDSLAIVAVLNRILSR